MACPAINDGKQKQLLLFIFMMKHLLFYQQLYSTVMRHLW